MTSAERTVALTGLAKQIATELNKLVPLRPWTVVEPTEDTYSVYLRNAGKARIYIAFDGYENAKRVLVNGYLHIGKNGQYVEVYERGADGKGWDRVSVPSITVALSRGCAAIAKDIAKRFLPEYLRIFALAEEKLAKDAAYEATIAKNLQRMGKATGVKVSAENLYGREEVRREFTWRQGESRYHTVKVSDTGCDLQLQDLTFEQAEHIIAYLKK